MATEEGKWPSQYYGVQLLPPLVYCPTHKRWEGYDESIPGLCDYCCLESPCPMGHVSDLSAWPEDEEDDTIVLEFLDWS